VRSEIPIANLINFGLNIISGLTYLHNKNVIHRDLACRNIFVKSNTSCTIGDFGSATKEGSSSKLDRYAIRWTDPECFQTKSFSSSCDIYSFGIVFWEIMTEGKLNPFDNFDNEQLINELLKNHYVMPKPEKCLDEAYEIMRDCWKPSKERPSSNEIYEKLTKLSKQYEVDDDAEGKKVEVITKDPVTYESCYIKTQSILESIESQYVFSHDVKKPESNYSKTTVDFDKDPKKKRRTSLFSRSIEKNRIFSE